MILRVESVPDRVEAVASGAARLRTCAVICTRERPQALRRALRSLLAQTRPPHEILVVDNGEEGDAARRVAEGAGATVRYVREARPGLDFARNRALESTTADVVSFLDDDAVADPEWMAETVRRFLERPRLGAVMGRVEALALETAGQRLFEANGGFGRGGRPILLPRDAAAPLRGFPVPLAAWAISVGSGASMALRRRAAREIGGFDEALDMGSFLPGGGDLDMLWRLLMAGWEVAYEPEVRAYHEHRRELNATVRQIAEHNRALVAMLSKAAMRARGRRRLGMLAFLAWRLLKPGVRLARRAVGRDPLPAGALLRVWGASWRGLVAYPAARRRARRIEAEADGGAAERGAGGRLATGVADEGANP